MADLVTIYGGSGFIGRYIARRLASEGWRIRVAVRNPDKANFMRSFGAADQIEAVTCNISDNTSVVEAMDGASAVINCVGVLSEIGANTFAATQSEGAALIARAAAAQGISRFVQLSAIGADTASSSIYAQTKAAGEAAVIEHVPSAVILRPSIVFGAEDQFFNLFASMAKLGPVLPVVGGSTRFQPVYVDDVAHAAVLGLAEDVQGIFELGGPDIETFRQLMQRMLTVIGKRRLVIDMPFPVARLMGFSLDTVQKLSLGLITNGMITSDQVRNLARDNIVSSDAKGFAELGIKPAAMETVLPEYLARFR